MDSRKTSFLFGMARFLGARKVSFRECILVKQNPTKSIVRGNIQQNLWDDGIFNTLIP